jgi:hypothetical protein
MKCLYFVGFVTLLPWEATSTCNALHTWHTGLKLVLNPAFQMLDFFFFTLGAGAFP